MASPAKADLVSSLQSLPGVDSLPLLRSAPLDLNWSEDPLIGLSVPVGDDLFLARTDDGFELLTHGTDPPAAPLTPVEAQGQAGVLNAPARRPACSSAGKPQIHLVYAQTPSGPGKKHGKRRARSAARHMNGMIMKAARAYTGGRKSVRLRVGCTRRGRMKVNTFRARSGMSFTGLVGEARQHGMTKVTSKYLIFYGDRNTSICGMAQVMPDDRDTVLNLNNNTRYPMYGAVWRGCWGDAAPLHETTHMMGAVQRSAPDSTGSAHCNDGLDIMCYNDGGPRSKQRRVCVHWQYDCGHNDYFDPTPRDYLSQHWDVGGKPNRFLKRH